jgi:hypothetical protein
VKEIEFQSGGYVREESSVAIGDIPGVDVVEQGNLMGDRIAH